jgi:Flp pilus assembly pilin Flp
MGADTMYATLRALRRRVLDRRGVAAAEYAILAVGIVIIVGAAITILVEPNNSAFVILGNTVVSTQTDMINNLASR